MDRVFRGLVAILILVLYFTNVLSGLISKILLGFAMLYILTSAIGYCPVYKVLNMNTRQKKTD